MNDLIPTSSRHLYPVDPDPDADRLIWQRVRSERDGAGRMVLTVPLSPVEREMIDRRRRAIAPALAPATKSEIRKVVSEMLVGFGSARETNDAAAIATIAQFITMLNGLPLFAIARACLRFGQGQVTADDIGERQPPRKDFAPSTAQLRTVAEKIARPFYDKHRTAALLLKATVEREPLSPEEKKRSFARVREMNEGVKRHFAGVSLDDERERSRSEESLAETLRLANERHARAEYAAAGIEPILSADGKTVVSLSMLIALGHRIETDQFGKKMLVKGSAA